MSEVTVVRSEVVETGFGFYTDDELLQLSCCRVTSTLATDALGNSLVNGLNDLRMGPTDSQTICTTCRQNYIQCPGHCGHIELDVPVYRPLLFPALYQILRAKCGYCHKLKLSSLKSRTVLVKLKLLEMGDISSANSLDDMLLPSQIFVDENDLEGKGKIKDMEHKLKIYEEKYTQYLKKLKSQKPVISVSIKSMQRDIIEQFQKNVVSIRKCENCDGNAVFYRRDGYSKIFQKPFSKRVKGRVISKHHRLKTALESLHGNGEGDKFGDDESLDNDEDDEENIPTEGDKYVAPLEVEAQMKLLWRHDCDLLEYIWSRATDFGYPSRTKSAERYQLFFQRIVLVPPNRFRPQSKDGTREALHPHSVHLTRILEANDKVKRISHESALLQQKTAVTSSPMKSPNKSKNSDTNINSSSSSSSNNSNSDNMVVDVNNTTNTTQDEEENDDINMKKLQNNNMSKLITAWIELQNAVNCFIDSSKDPNILASNMVSGIRQLLERKEGLFRMHMMGKRVNYCARSVISPDPYIGTNEVGLPVNFAKTLHYPTPVNDWNIRYLRKLVQNGPDEYPGANQIEYQNGQILKLDRMTAQDRSAKAKLLRPSAGMKVYRHLIDGDILLVNRQPTLHKPGIMAHRARVLKHVKEKTLRLSYANCNSYNADFDGDEMNCHFLQNELARAEAYFLCNTDNQYIVPTSGNPLRGLIQDHVASGVKLTCRNTFLSHGEFMQLVYIALSGLPGTEVVNHLERIQLPKPMILKPIPKWSGKQVISALMQHLCRGPLPPFHLDGKTRTPPTAFGVEQEEHIVIFRYGELLCGVLDKAAMGNSSLGVVHAVYELYGAELAGRILNAFGRLFTYYLQDAGQSCGVESLTLNQSAENDRKNLLSKVLTDSYKGFHAFMQGSSIQDAIHSPRVPSKKEMNESEKQLESLVATDRMMTKIRLDGAMQSVINKSASDVIKACLPGGLERPFLKNDFSMMVLTGAKGSAVNQSQISCFLGQQALEGLRVPVMISGKTLPSFRPYDSSPRASGFVQDRFLTGVKPQEYYFHCMAGREGLVDTAVKTSRSGYLQRCLVKHLEELKIHYDMTVRDSASNIVQFLYGEDGLDPVHSNLLGGKANQLLFLARNNQSLAYKYSLTSDFFQQGFDLDQAKKAHDYYKRALTVMKSEKLKQETSLMSSSSSSSSSIYYTKDYFSSSSPMNDIEFKKGDIVLARKKLQIAYGWGRENLQHTWYVAEIIKVRKNDDTNSKKVKYDIRYTDDSIEKKVPLALKYVSSTTINKASCSSYITLLKPGLPDTVMNSVRLDSCVGVCSEKLQASLQEYIRLNPDHVITSHTTDTTVKAESLELLLWIKYMRSLACPGEAVGCIAAQSIGEPSTQMTLNTFHLAGHGGANVTLGIPRLREILMTASRVPKTPMMIIPLAKAETSHTSKQLARHLSKVTLHDLLYHQGGVEVTEKFKLSIDNVWERVYAIKLIFEDYSKIYKAFGFSFEQLIETVKMKFILKLNNIIKVESKKYSNKKVQGRMDTVYQFLSKVKESPSGSKSKENGDNDDEDGDSPDHDDEDGDKRGKGRKKSNDSALSDDDDEEEEDDDDDDPEQGTLQFNKNHEISGYDEDDEVPVGGRRNTSKNTSGRDEDDDYNDANVNTQLQKIQTNRVAFDLNDNEDETDDEEDENESEDSDSDNEASGSTSNKPSTTPVASKKSVVSTSKTPSKTPNTKGTKSDLKSTTKKSEMKKTPKKSPISDDIDIEVNQDENYIRLQVAMPAHLRRLLMVQLVEKACILTTVQSTSHIANAYAVTSDINGIEHQAVQTEGVNFEAIWKLSKDYNVLLNELKCNDIWQVLQTYGVEAARMSIVNEIMSVFGSYGIDVNARHLSLIADHMTRTGSFSPMNRAGMLECSSPFLQMSFESTSAFLTKASQEGYYDTQQSPSARIVLGSVPKLGTGCFELMMPLKKV